MSIEIIKGNEINLNQRIEVSRIFANGFYQWLKYFSKDIEILAKAFEHSFVFEEFYFLLAENKVCAIAACTDGKRPSIKLVKKDLLKHLGLIKGSIANVILKGEFENHPYPFTLEQGCGSIEFVAVSTECRNKGYGVMLLNHIIDNDCYNQYVLEVADTNLPAVGLYEKIGFHEFKRVPQKHSEKSGIDNLLYLKYKK